MILSLKDTCCVTISPYLPVMKSSTPGLAVFFPLLLFAAPPSAWGCSITSSSHFIGLSYNYIWSFALSIQYNQYIFFKNI